MIPELGHFALILALSIALGQGVLPLLGASSGNSAWMALAPARRRAASSCSLLIAFGCLTLGLRHRRLLGALAAQQLQLAAADGLQVHRGVGQPRGLDPAVGADPVGLDLRRVGVLASSSTSACWRACSA